MGDSYAVNRWLFVDSSDWQSTTTTVDKCIPVTSEMASAEGKQTRETSQFTKEETFCFLWPNVHPRNASVDDLGQEAENEVCQNVVKCVHLPNLESITVILLI